MQRYCLVCNRELEKKKDGRKYCGKQGLEGTCAWKVSRLMLKLNSIKERCTNQKHKNYIRYKDTFIDSEWMKNSFSFAYWSLKNGWSKEKTVIDRIDNSKGYSPENCRFVNWIESARNKRNNVTNWQEKTRKCRKCKLTKHFFDFAISRKEVGEIAYECKFCRKLIDKQKYKNKIK